MGHKPAVVVNRKPAEEFLTETCSSRAGVKARASALRSSPRTATLGSNPQDVACGVTVKAQVEAFCHGPRNRVAANAGRRLEPGDL